MTACCSFLGALYGRWCGMPCCLCCSCTGIRRKIDMLCLAPRELWVVLLLKLMNSFALFASLTMFFIYLTDEFDLSYPTAGYVIGVTGLLVSVYGAFCGPLIDRIGVKRSYILGALSGSIGGLMISFSANLGTVLAALFVFTAFGMALGIPVLSIGVKRYTFEPNRTIAFGLFYMVMNIGAAISFALVDVIRGRFAQGIDVDLKDYKLVSIDTNDTLTPEITPFAGNATVEMLSVAMTTVHQLAKRNSSIADVASAPVPAEMGVPGPAIDIANVFVYHATAARLIFAMSAIVVCMSALLAAVSLRDVYLNEKGMVVPYNPRIPDIARREGSGNTGPSGGANTKKRNFLVSLVRDRFFWRLVVFQLILIGVTMVFKHMDNTFPTYLRNTLGNDAKFGTLKSINPILITIAVPIFSYALKRFDIYRVIMVGSLISASSVFIMCAKPSYTTAVVFFVAFSIGEAIYSPRAVEYTLLLSPNGKEGSYIALAYMPLFLAKFGADILSGNLLQWYCPPDNPSHCPTLWLVVGIIALCSPIGLFLASRFIHSKDVIDIIEVRNDIILEDYRDGEHARRNSLDENYDDNDFGFSTTSFQKSSVRRDDHGTIELDNV